MKIGRRMRGSAVGVSNNTAAQHKVICFFRTLHNIEGVKIENTVFN